MKTGSATMFVASGLALLLATGPVLAGADGTADEAKAMLARAVAAVLANEPNALAAFDSGADGFRQGDLYVFCARRDGTVDAHIDPAQIGRKIQEQYRQGRRCVWPGDDGGREGRPGDGSRLYVAPSGIADACP